MILQAQLFEELTLGRMSPPHGQLLKWIGNKQRFAQEIVATFPRGFQRYIEPFLGSGAVLATVAPKYGIASDTFGPLMEIWVGVKDDPNAVKRWYEERWFRFMRGDSREEYEHIKREYNKSPNGPDLLFLCRSCYGGVVRFRMADGFMSTPVGVHKPVSPASFNKRVDEWHSRIQNTLLYHRDYKETIDEAVEGDVVYCDPPYSNSQAILYGAQSFSLPMLLDAIRQAKNRGAFIALSIDGTKKSGEVLCELPLIDGLFE